MSLVETLTIFNILADLEPSEQLKLLERIVSYFFLNPVEIVNCPFLVEQDCMIYNNRFFGCRAYGLWSAAYYDKLSASSKEAKKFLRQQWLNLGVALPASVIDKQVPYCKDVVVTGDLPIDDDTIDGAWDGVMELSAQLAPWHQVFQEKYYGDAAFLVASLIFGINRAVQLKFEIVKNIAATGDRSRLHIALDEIKAAGEEKGLISS